MKEGPTELEEVVIDSNESNEEHCYVCYEAKDVTKSPCVCTRLFVCKRCFDRLQSESEICTVCRTQFETANKLESKIRGAIDMRRSLKILLSIFSGLILLLLLMFGVGILVYAIDREKWPAVVPEMYGTIFLYGFCTVMIAAIMFGCGRMAR